MTTPIITFNLPTELCKPTNWVRQSGSTPSHRGQLNTLFSNIYKSNSITIINLADLRDDDSIIPVCNFGEYLIAININYMLADKQYIHTNYKTVVKPISTLTRELIAVYTGYGDPQENIYYMPVG